MRLHIFVVIAAALFSGRLGAQQVCRVEWTHAGFVGAGWEGRAGDSRGFVWTDGEASGAGGISAGPMVAGVLRWPDLWNWGRSNKLPLCTDTLWDSPLTPTLKTDARTGKVWGTWLGQGLSGVWFSSSEEGWMGGLALGLEKGGGWPEFQMNTSLTRSEAFASDTWFERSTAESWEINLGTTARGGRGLGSWAVSASAQGDSFGGVAWNAAGRAGWKGSGQDALGFGAAVSDRGIVGSLAFNLDVMRAMKLSGGVEYSRKVSTFTMVAKLAADAARLPLLPFLGMELKSQGVWNPENFSLSVEGTGKLTLGYFNLSIQGRLGWNQGKLQSLMVRCNASWLFSGGRIRGSVSAEQTGVPEWILGMDMELKPAAVSFEVSSSIMEGSHMRWKCLLRWIF